MAILSRSAARRQVGSQQRAGKTVVFTNGCFDLLHAGHIEVLNQAKTQGDYLVVGLNGDKSVRRLKGSARPIQPVDDRALILDAIGVVDLVVIFNEDTPANLIETLAPDVLVKGSDYPEAEIAGADFIRRNDGRVERIILKTGRSTSNLIERIRQSDSSEKS